MLPYYIMVAVPAILMMLFGRRSDKFSEEKKNKTVIWFFFGIVLIMLSLRGERVGSDTPTYLGNFEKISKFSFKEVLENYEDEVVNSISLIADDGKTSMYQDIIAERKTEVDIFSGEIIKLGRQFGIKTPYNLDIYNKIKEIEKEFLWI